MLILRSEIHILYKSIYVVCIDICLQQIMLLLCREKIGFHLTPGFSILHTIQIPNTKMRLFNHKERTKRSLSHMLRSKTFSSENCIRHLKIYFWKLFFKVSGVLYTSIHKLELGKIRRMILKFNLKFLMAGCYLCKNSCLYQKIGNILLFSRKMFRKINASKD